jgi:hypothetical protein
MGINDRIRKHNAKVSDFSGQGAQGGERGPVDDKKAGNRFWDWMEKSQNAHLASLPDRTGVITNSRQARKAREHELKAGKIFRRTKKHLKKAERHQRRAGITGAATAEALRAAAERKQAEAAERVQASQPTTAPSSGNDVIDQLERLGKLKDQGILSDEEFQAQKAKVLSD